MPNHESSVFAMVLGTSLCSIIFVLLTITYTSSRLKEEQVNGIQIFSHAALLLFGVMSSLLVLGKFCNKIDVSRPKGTAQRSWNINSLEMTFLWMFAVVYLVQTILYLLTVVSNTQEMKSTVMWIANIFWETLLLTFIMSQTLLFSIFKNSKMSITGQNIRYSLTMTGVCNVAQCFHKMLKESRTTNADTFISTRNQTQDIIFRNWINELQPYVTPMTIEYNIMSLSFIFSILKFLNNCSDSNDRYPSLNLDEMPDDTETLPILTVRRSPQRMKSDLVFFLLGLLPTLPLIALEGYISHNQATITETDAILIAFECACMTNQCVMSLLCIIGMCHLAGVQQSNGLIRQSTHIRDLILILCCLGVQMFHVFGGFGNIMNNSYLVQHMVTTNHIVSFFGALLQTLFIIQSKHSSSLLHIRSKILRKVLLVLGIVNFMSWLCDSIFVRHVNNLTMPESKYFGEEYWNIVCDLFLPLAIYYRFHSAMECYKIFKNMSVI